MRYIKTIDNITKAGFTEFGEGYRITDDVDQAEAIIIRSSSMHDMHLPKNIRAVARAGAGFNNIPIDRFAQEGIVVFNTPGANSNAVKELMVSLFVLASRDVLGGIAWCRAHEDDPDAYKNAEKAKKAFVGQEIKGRTVGVVGLGNVGSKVANALVDLGMTVYGYDPYIAVKDAWQLSRDVRRVSDLDELCRESEYLTVHVPFKEDTEGMIGEAQLAEMPEGGVVFNYSRERIVNEDAIDAALRNGHIRRYLTDFATPKALKMPNTIVTPHTGAGTGEAEVNCANMALAQVKDYLENGNITNSVNYPAISLGARRDPQRLVALHANVPNMIGQITATLAGEGLNIQRMANDAAGANAVTLVDLDRPVSADAYNKIMGIEGMWRVRTIDDTSK